MADQGAIGTPSVSKTMILLTINSYGTVGGQNVINWFVSKTLESFGNVGVSQNNHYLTSLPVATSPYAWTAGANPVVGIFVGAPNLGDTTTWKHISGTVYDAYNNPAVRTILVYDQSSWNLLTSSTSSSAGTFNIGYPFSGNCKVIAVDSTGLYDDLVFSNVASI